MSLQYFQAIDKDFKAFSELAADSHSIFVKVGTSDELKIHVWYILPNELKAFEEDFTLSQLKVLLYLLGRNNQSYLCAKRQQKRR